MKPLVTRRGFATGMAATIAVPCFGEGFGQRLSMDLLDEVNKLPTGAPEEKRKKAALLWALEDANAADNAGLWEDSTVLRADVRAVLSQPIGQAAPKLSAALTGIFPKITTREGNPWLKATLDSVEQIVRKGQTYRRGSNPEGKDLGTTYGYPYILLTTEAANLAQTFGNPDSPLYGDARLVAPILRRFEACFEVLTPGQKLLADFGVAPHLSEMYCLLKLSFPGLILSSRQRAWESALTRNCDAILAQRAQVFSGPGMPTESLAQMLDSFHAGDCYPNAQSHLINGLLFGGMALQNERYLSAATKGVELMATAFYPDGGTAYISRQNECYAYHGIMIEDLARLWQATGNEQARRLVAASRWYYPLSITPQAVAEYSSAPCWKHYWNAVKGTSTAAVVASLEHCGYNALVGENDKPAPNWLAATVYTRVQPERWWDNAIVYDRNIEGPRGRYGTYSFCATARKTDPDNRGKITYVGSLLVSGDPAQAQPSWPLDAGLDGAWSEVRLNNKPETVDRWATHACLSRDESNSSISSEYFGSVTAIYRLAQYETAPVNFRGRQQWLLTPERLVGALLVESLEEQMAYAMGVAIKTVSGRGPSGIRKFWKTKGENLFEYGPLTIRLWPAPDSSAVDLVASGRQSAAYTDTFSGNEGKCGLLTLVDPESGVANQQTPVSYARGAAVRAVVEIYPTAAGGAQRVAVSDLGTNLAALEVAKNHQFLRLIHNYGATEVTLPAGGFVGFERRATVHRVGESQRLPFLPPMESRQPEVWRAETPPRLVPGEHVVLRTNHGGS